MCILCTPRPTYRSTYRPISQPMYRPINRPTLDQYVGWHIYRHLADILTEICRSTYQPIYRLIVAGHSTDRSVDMSTESGCLIVSRHVDWEATDILLILHWYLAPGHGDCSLRCSHLSTADIPVLIPAFQRLLCIPNPKIQPNRLHIGLVIEHYQTGTFRWVRLLNSITPIELHVFGAVWWQKSFN